jgi:hypothetical protein
MHDFSTKYRGVVHFGLWAEERADLLGQQDAFALVAHAVRDSYAKDVRSVELNDALTYLERFSTRRGPFQDFRKALDMTDPELRQQQLRDSAHRIARILSN